jgi:hypothetical protein
VLESTAAPWISLRSTSESDGGASVDSEAQHGRLRTVRAVSKSAMKLVTRSQAQDCSCGEERECLLFVAAGCLVARAVCTRRLAPAMHHGELGYNSLTQKMQQRSILDLSEQVTVFMRKVVRRGYRPSSV